MKSDIFEFIVGLGVIIIAGWLILSVVSKSEKLYLSQCSWKPQIDGLKNAETSSMDFCTQLITLEGWKKQFENLWAYF